MSGGYLCISYAGVRLLSLPFGGHLRLRDDVRLRLHRSLPFVLAPPVARLCFTFHSRLRDSLCPKIIITHITLTDLHLEKKHTHLCYSYAITEFAESVNGD